MPYGSIYLDLLLMKYFNYELESIKKYTQFIPSFILVLEHTI